MITASLAIFSLLPTEVCEPVTLTAVSVWPSASVPSVIDAVGAVNSVPLYFLSALAAVMDNARF